MTVSAPLKHMLRVTCNVTPGSTARGTGDSGGWRGKLARPTVIGHQPDYDHNGQKRLGTTLCNILLKVFMGSERNNLHDYLNQINITPKYFDVSFV